MNKKQKKMLARILIAAALMIMLHFVPAEGAVRFLLYMIPYLVIGYDILIKAFKGICNRQVFDESFLMAVATIGAIALAITDNGDYTEAIAVMLFYQIGEWFQSYAVGKSRRNISELMDIRPDHANLERNGRLEQVDPDEVEIGTHIIVRPGEKVPIDGVVVEGTSTLDTAALTGESIPRDVCAGEEVVSGCINMSGVLTIRTTREFGESTVSKILDLVENASSRKSRSEAFITRFARVYTPAVCISALALALLCACSKGAAKTPPTRPADFTSTERQFNTPADGDTIAIFDTSLGEVRAVLYPDAAPMAVYNFVGLARSGYYDNTTIWRSEYGFAVQGGDATGTGTGGSTIWSNNPYPPEASADLKHYAGALCAAFAAGGDVTGGNSQFYFVTALPDSVSSSDRQAELTANGYTDAQIAAYAAVGGLPYLDNTDTVFGQVYQGMDVVDSMACVDTVKDDDGNDTYRPTEEAAITINSVTITTYSSAEDNGLDTVG